MTLRARGRALLVGAALACIAGPVRADAQAAAATVREYKKVFRTYPYSDPNPIPIPGRIYPYYRFDGYTDQPTDREWTVVELENAYLKVLVLPEIGGKIWTAIEKSTGRPFIYNNQVVKFRDIAMRGPWTSGGIEANYGIIGHTPNCATPVDYLARSHADGSVSVVIGVLDLLTRTPWRLEVRLPADKAWFSTRSFWQNTTPLEQPYYTWMNAGLKASGNLQFVYPGTRYLGHNGEFAPWPRHASNGKDLSFYEQNDFGSYKSYHVFGTHTDFFGAYWHDDDLGMARYSTRDDKPGKKIWIWGLSPQGMIWERLLTDSDGQYVEVQSGRLFNQAAEASALTPFKHRGFAPATSDTWTEYWFPVKGTRGFVKASDYGALNVTRENGAVTLRFSPTGLVDDEIQVYEDGRLVFSTRLSLAPLQTWTHALGPAVRGDHLLIRIGGVRFEYSTDSSADVLSRPLETPKDFDWESVFGLWLKGKELIRQRAYTDARSAIEACLRKDPNYAPALVDLAMLRYRAMDYEGAFDASRKALSIDTYDPAGNYYYGLAALAIGRLADARDGFEIASQSHEYRAASWLQLAKLSLHGGDLPRADAYALRSLDANALNVEALQVLALSSRLRRDAEGSARALERLTAIDPLNHFARFERAQLGGGDEERRAFVSGIRSEMPHETFLELAIWYFALGRPTETEDVLSLAPPTPEVLYWLAYLGSRRQDAAFRDRLRAADAASPRLQFPFRAETVPVLQWAAEARATWQPMYYLALIHAGLGNTERAAELLDRCGNDAAFAPLYALRARLLTSSAPDRALADLRRAANLDPAEWRFGKLITEAHLDAGRYAEALASAKTSAAAHPDSYILGLLYARTLLLNGRDADAAALLDALHVLPYEGATEGRRLYRRAHLMLAVEALARNDATAARREIAAARLWPAQLGVGRPYPQDLDERLEDWLEARVARRAGQPVEASAALERCVAAGRSDADAGALAAALALRDANRPGEANARFERWAAAVPDPQLIAWGRAAFSAPNPPRPPAGGPDDYMIIRAALATLQR